MYGMPAQIHEALSLMCCFFASDIYYFNLALQPR